ncbi:MAG: hypothetical protein ACFNM7_08875 [Prevotella conceptionensis]
MHRKTSLWLRRLQVAPRKNEQAPFRSTCTEVPRDGRQHHLSRPILGVTRRRFIKCYFIGDRRVASKIGVGIFQNAYGHGANLITAG